MKFETTIKYQEGYLPTPKCRKMRFRECSEIVYTEIKEVDKKDMPVAFKCKGHKYRVYNNKLYVLVSDNSIVANMREKSAIERLGFVFKKCSTFYWRDNTDTREKMIGKANSLDLDMN